jgi:4-amino-4-deoxy-L-arabinose transferase-like glycosyltransferase
MAPATSLSHEAAPVGPPSTEVWSRRWRRLLVLVFLLATAARTATAIRYAAAPLGGDEIEYDALARGLAANGSYESQPGFSRMLYSEPGAPTSFRPPGWPFVLAQFYRAFGHRPMAARIGLATWNGLGAVVLALLTRRLFADPRVAVAAGLVWALWPASFWYPGTRSPTLGSEGLSLPLLLFALLALHEARRHQALPAIMAGLLLGGCTLIRSNFSLLIPSAVAWILWTSAGPLRSRLRTGSLILLAAGAVVLPWMLRNLQQLGSFTIATQREPLFLGNNAWARGSYDSEFFTAETGQVAWLLERHPDFRQKSEVEKSRIYAASARAYARAEPRREAWLVGRRALLFFSPLRENERGGNTYDWAFATLAAVCLLGWRWFLRANAESHSLALVPLLAAFVTCLIVFFLPRYRYPAEPLLVALACQTVNGAMARHGFARVAAAVGLVAAANLVLTLTLR